MSQLEAIREANAYYVEHFPHPPNMPSGPTRKVALLTCMDCRLEPHISLGLRTGEANWIRNAGGRASDDAIRSLVISTQLLGATEIFVIQHSDCGMESKNQEEIVEVLSVDGNAQALAATDIDWLSIPGQPETLLADVMTIRNHPLISDNIPVHGMIKDPKTGAVHDVFIDDERLPLVRRDNVAG